MTPGLNHDCSKREREKKGKDDESEEEEKKKQNRNNKHYIPGTYANLFIDTWYVYRYLTRPPTLLPIN